VSVPVDDAYLVRRVEQSLTLSSGRSVDELELDPQSASPLEAQRMSTDVVYGAPKLKPVAALRFCITNGGVGDDKQEDLHPSGGASPAPPPPTSRKGLGVRTRNAVVWLGWVRQ
jgi:hypothetical protein